jgi:hypothetical protein
MIYCLKRWDCIINIQIAVVKNVRDYFIAATRKGESLMTRAQGDTYCPVRGGFYVAMCDIERDNENIKEGEIQDGVLL